MNIAVVYGTKYGTTRQYAAWIAEALGADLFDRNAVRPERLSGYDCVVYGGGLYAGGICGIRTMAKCAARHFVVFTVGLADPQTTDYAPLLAKGLPRNLRDAADVFHFRGGMDYRALGLVHRCMMAMMKVTVARKKESERTAENTAFLATYGGTVDFTSRESIAPLVDHVRRLAEQTGRKA